MDRQTLTLSAPGISLEWEVAGADVAERVGALRGSRAATVARSDPARGGLGSLTFAVVPPGRERRLVTVVPREWDVAERCVVLRADAEDVPVEVAWEATDEGIRVSVRATFVHWVHLEALRCRYLYAPDDQAYADVRPLDLVHTPNLRPLEHDVIGDHRFHSPALVLQTGPLGFALLPDVSRLEAMRTRRARTALDYDVKAGPHPVVEYGFLPWEGRDHVFYEHRPGSVTPISNQTLSFGYNLLASADAGPASFHRPVARHYHRHHLAPALRARPEQQLRPFEDWERHTWYEYGELLWWEAEVDGVAVGNFDTQRDFHPGSTWATGDREGAFLHWFQSLRTALGMRRSGIELGDERLVQRAGRVLELCLAAPQRDGAFPGRVSWNEAANRLDWEKDDSFGGLGNWYHAFDMCWTGYWLLAWHEELGGDPRILARCEALGGLLLRSQLPSGCIPSFYDGDGTPNRRELYDDNAETAGCATFLLRLHAVTGEGRWLEGARRALRYIRDDVAPANRWYDFETFFSCSPKELDFRCDHTDQLPQNNLSLMQACRAFLLLADATGDADALAEGERLLDYLSLFQQAWSPPWLTPDLLGGFGTQNTDAEWSDARQCYAADLYFDYFEATGEREYFERGVAAMRATFPIAPYENWAHLLEDSAGAWTGMHWGTGSAMTSVVFARERYGGAFVDADSGWGVGLDGCTVEDVEVDRDRLSVRIRVAFPGRGPLRLVVRSERPRELRVNELDLGRLGADELAAGVEVAAG